MTAGVMHISRELREWLAQSMALGCSEEGMIDGLIGGGYDPDLAHRIVAYAFSRGGLLPPEAEAEAAADAGGPEHEVPQPLPIALASGASRIVLPDRTVSVVLSLQKPRVVLVKDFLSDEECDGLIEQARTRLERSRTINRETGSNDVHPARTSEDTFLNNGSTPLVRTICARIAAFTRWPEQRGEDLQVLRYGIGAEYEPHYDYFDLKDPSTRKILKRGGQRVATVIMYLNTPQAGGATVFPQSDLEIAASRGHALFFSYSTPTPDSRSLHGGTPVVAGEKWICTRWLRQTEFK